MFCPRKRDNLSREIGGQNWVNLPSSPRHKTIPRLNFHGWIRLPPIPDSNPRELFTERDIFLGQRKPVDTNEGAVFAIGREFEISSMDSLFVPRHKPLLGGRFSSRLYECKGFCLPCYRNVE